MHVISSPSVPFWGHIPDGVHPGLVIHIDGHIPHHSDNFAINLMKGQDVGHHAEKHNCIGLHINPRVAEDYIVFNSRHHKDWGNEDRHHHSHSFHKGSSFSLTIHVDSEYYRVSVNGTHLCNFHHRMPYHEMGVLFIDGCVDIRSIEYRREHEQTSHFTAHHQTAAYVPGHYEGDHHQSHHDSHHHHHH